MRQTAEHASTLPWCLQPAVGCTHVIPLSQLCTGVRMPQGASWIVMQGWTPLHVAVSCKTHVKHDLEPDWYVLERWRDSVEDLCHDKFGHRCKKVSGCLIG